MEANAISINMDNLRATGRMAEKQMNMALEQAELNGEVIPQEVLNFINVIKDDTTLEALVKTTDNASVQKIMNDNGVPMTEEDVDGLLEVLGKASKKLVESDGKLTEEELEQISGGGWLSDAWNSVKNGVKKAWDWCNSTTVGRIITAGVIATAVAALALSGLGAAVAFTYGVCTVGVGAGFGAAVAGVGGVIATGIIGAQQALTS